ncbi:MULTISPECIES: wax ester/triacylglycerol synthase domain-containing protein [Pseudofrankia]|uniref:wax ester/triacylglycerol synthase domain-containing protein n=1 Tax=Pseudofrankia TaxID=2994363 RepID=UPI000234B446|nr:MULTISPECIES: wax ester/triacylglycerol synthase domain-containing protein [Pseudofrankia]OHV27429.1 hypothetical protein BCD49_38885 [Pseudofrankia sp. EUN1h]
MLKAVQHGVYERPLSLLDLALLGYQRRNPGTQIALGYLLRVAGECDLDAVRAAAADRLRRFPALTERLAHPRGASGPPVWAARPDVDVSAHIREHLLPAGAGDAGVAAFVEQEYQAPVRLDAPPWQVWLLREPGAGETTVLFRASHVWLDGGALHRAMVLLFGARDDADDDQPQWRRTGRTTPLARASAVLNSVTWATPSTSLRALTRPLAGEVRLGWATTSTDRLRDIGHAFGTTVNDVFLVALSEALDTWTGPAGRRHAPLALMPMSTRRPEEHDLLSNFMVGARIRLPCGLESPQRRFEAIQGQTVRFRGGSRSGAGLRWCFEKVPAGFRPAALSMAMRPLQTMVSTSNLGTFAAPMDVAGHPVTTAIPVPVRLPGQRVFLVLGSLAPTDTQPRTTSLGIVTDRNVPNGRALADLWLAALDRLERAAGFPASPYRRAADPKPVAASVGD